MRKIFSLVKIILIFISTIFTSCADELIKEMEVCGISHDFEKVTINFSSIPEKSAFQKGFSISEDNATLVGTFSYSGKSASFYPVNGIRENYDYQILLSTQIEDVDGRSLMSAIPYFFSTRKNSDEPYIISQTPAKNQNISEQPSEFVFEFSKSINAESFDESFNISPSFGYLRKFSDNNKKVHIIPSENLEKNTLYTFTISTNLFDTNRNYLKEDYVSVFKFADDNTNPDFTVSCEYFEKSNNNSQNNVKNFNLCENQTNENIPLNSKIILNFSKEIDLSYVAGFISVTPNLSYSISMDNQTKKKFTITPTSPEWGNSYTFRINKGIEDYSGNKTDLTSCYTIKYNSENDRPVKFNSAIFQTSENKFINFYESDNYSNLPLDSIYFPKNTEKNADFFLTFEISKNAEKIDIFKLMENVNFSVTNDCCEILLKSAKIISENQLPPSLENLKNLATDDGKLAIVKFVAEITNKDNSGLVYLELSDEIADSLRNKMESEINLTFNK